MKLQRVFIALPVPLPVAEQIIAQAAPLLPPGSAAAVPENLHITLAFLGKLPEAMLPLLQENLQALAELLPQTIRLDAIAPFPTPQGSILAAWVQPTDALLALFSGVKSILGALQITADYHDSFLPHITLARLNAISETSAEPLADDTRTYGAHRLGIYEGGTTAQGYRYQCLWSIQRNAGSSST